MKIGIIGTSDARRMDCYLRFEILKKAEIAVFVANIQLQVAEIAAVLVR